MSATLPYLPPMTSIDDENRVRGSMPPMTPGFSGPIPQLPDFAGPMQPRGAGGLPAPTSTESPSAFSMPSAHEMGSSVREGIGGALSYLGRKYLEPQLTVAQPIVNYARGMLGMGPDTGQPLIGQAGVVGKQQAQAPATQQPLPGTVVSYPDQPGRAQERGDRASAMPPGDVYPGEGQMMFNGKIVDLPKSKPYPTIAVPAGPGFQVYGLDTPQGRYYAQQQAERAAAMSGIQGQVMSAINRAKAMGFSNGTAAHVGQAVGAALGMQLTADAANRRTEMEAGNARRQLIPMTINSIPNPDPATQAMQPFIPQHGYARVTDDGVKVYDIQGRELKKPTAPVSEADFIEKNAKANAGMDNPAGRAELKKMYNKKYHPDVYAPYKE